MKDIPIEELAVISAGIHEAALRVGCTDVSITGRIWPGGRLGGSPEEAARFVEFSWLRAAVVNGRAIFEETDPRGFAALLNQYGLGDDPSAEQAFDPTKAEEAPRKHAAPQPTKVELTVQVLPATMAALNRHASAAGRTVGEFLDWKFRASDSSPEAEQINDSPTRGQTPLDTRAVEPLRDVRQPIGERGLTEERDLCKPAS